jgi:hypothetical protein
MPDLVVREPAARLPHDLSVLRVVPFTSKDSARRRNGEGGHGENY